MNHYESTTNHQQFNMNQPFLPADFAMFSAIGPLGATSGKLCHRPGHQLHQHLGARSHQRDQLPGPLVGICRDCHENMREMEEGVPDFAGKTWASAMNFEVF